METISNYEWDGKSSSNPIYKIELKPGDYHLVFDITFENYGTTTHHKSYYTDYSKCVFSGTSCPNHFNYPLLIAKVQANQTLTDINLCDSDMNPDPINF